MWSKGMLNCKTETFFFCCFEKEFIKPPLDWTEFTYLIIK